MAVIRFILLGLVCAGYVNCINGQIDWDETTTTTEIPETTPTTEPTTPSTTTMSTTTSQPTTVKPTTPRPNPPTSSGTWVVTDESTNITCIVVKLAASFVIPYSTPLGERNATLVMPNNATSNGSCLYKDENHQAITIRWAADDGNLEDFNSITITFERNQSRVEDVHGDDATSQYFVSHLEMQIFPDILHFPNETRDSKIDADLEHVNFYVTNVNNSYRCNSEDDVRLMVSGSTNQTALVRLTHVQMEAFRNLSNDKFSVASDCSADDILTSDIVPIAVGCALAALVVVVLIAYLIGRRRARQRGYQSV